MNRWSVTWDPSAVATATRFLDNDPDGLVQLMDAVDLLAADPRPAGSIPYGSDHLRRMHAGRYRVLFEISSEGSVVTVIHIGRTG